jgi:hypothetical protein
MGRGLRKLLHARTRSNHDKAMRAHLERLDPRIDQRVRILDVLAFLGD